MADRKNIREEQRIPDKAVRCAMGKVANGWATCSGLLVCTSILMVLLSPATSFAAACEQSVAKAMAVEGKVDVRHPDETQWQPVKLHDTFCPGDVIRVQERSRADIALSNQPMLRLDQNTTMTLGGIKKEGGSLIELVKGATHFFSRVPRNLEVRTAFVNAGVEGTEGVVRVTDDKTEVTIFEGKVVAANESGTLSITDGQSVVAEKGKAPSYQTVVKPRDAVQWALYYPPVLEVSPGAAVKEDDPSSLASRAARSLAVGRVDEANADLDRALKLDPKNSDALALQSVIAVVQNDKDKAMTLAQQAVAADPNSASAKTALSYAQQAQFDLKGARKTLEQEVQAHPDNALAWARLAELRASFSELDGALEAAQKAVALNPNLSRTQTVLGFAYLLQVKTTDAKAAFSKAIELDQADAMPRLGLGLAKFREGHVEEGRREMEVAASLDPNNAMIRSYLGKAYFEEKRDDMAEREYKNSKELDPKDPTPFFYDALQKQLTNRPVEALKDMEKAIELNGNRAVYRSNLAMDSDAAARSAALARTYTDLGFQQLALVEGWTAINTDPTSFTAARFLADSYAALPNHKIARVSELLRSQLLQPVNITPIQPRLAESNLFLLSSLGPAALGFNEFNTLMVSRDRITALTSGLIGDNKTLGGEAVVAGIYNKLSYSVGWSSFTTDGWRTNGQQQDHNGNGFLQYEISPQTSIQAEYRYRNNERGDTRNRFFPADFFPGEKNEEKTNYYRLGVRHNFSPDSILIATGGYQTKETSLNDFQPGFPLTSLSFKVPDRAANAEVQHLYRSQYVNLVSGAGYVDINSRLDSTFEFDPSVVPPPGNIAISSLDQDQKHTNVYSYSYLRLIPNVVGTLGVSADFLDSDSQQIGSRNQVNPKFGLMWNPFPDTTIRAAAFRTLKRTLITDQTLEPTQVAGFNQFFDDVSGTQAWLYGAAINQKFSGHIYGGVEVSKRDLNTSFLDFSIDPVNPVGRNVKWDEYHNRVYLFWTPHDWVALRAEYYYERLNRDASFSAGVSKLTTHRVPLGISFYHPSGVIANVTQTYYNQEGTFESFLLGGAAGGFQSGSASFWTTDVGLSYRMPKRFGLFTIGVNNLFDKQFNWFDTDPLNSMIQPTRLAFAKLTLALP